MPAKRTWSRCENCGGLISIDRCVLYEARGGVGTNLVPTIPRFLLDDSDSLSSGNPHTATISSVFAAARDHYQTELSR